MYVFGHVGITLAAALLGSGAYNYFSSRLGKPNTSEGDHSEKTNSPALKKSDFSLTSWAQTLSHFLDIRFLIIGSMLPDLIDKPLGYAFFSNGRVVSHTLLFIAVLLIVGVFMYLNYRNKWLLALGIGSLFHLVFDFMWSTPQTLFWPLYGWLFPKYEETDWITRWVNNLDLPTVYVPEFVGALVILAFIVMVIYQRKTTVFLKNGTM